MVVQESTANTACNANLALASEGSLISYISTIDLVSPIRVLANFAVFICRLRVLKKSYIEHQNTPSGIQ